MRGANGSLSPYPLRGVDFVTCDTCRIGLLSRLIGSLLLCYAGGAGGSSARSRNEKSATHVAKKKNRDRWKHPPHPPHNLCHIRGENGTRTRQRADATRVTLLGRRQPHLPNPPQSVCRGPLPSRERTRVVWLYKPMRHVSQAGQRCLDALTFQAESGGSTSQCDTCHTLGRK